jgi:hypothetical protein
MDADIDQLAEENGGYWGQHPEHPLEDWQTLVANDETRRGYWEWVEAQMQFVPGENLSPEGDDEDDDA